MVIKLKIAVCDTNKKHSNQIKNILSHILFEECESEIDELHNPSEIFNRIQSGRFQYDVVFLEVDFGLYTGMDIAGRLRSEKNNAEIIFITRNEHLILEGYKYRAFDYLLKPVSVTYISEVMHRFLKCFYIKDSVFSFKSGRETFNIRLEHINHFSSCGRVITIVSKFEDYTYYGKIDDLESILPAYLFLRPHQSYYVNLEYIKTFSKEFLTMHGNINIPISRKRLCQIETVLTEFFNKEFIKTKVGV